MECGGYAYRRRLCAHVRIHNTRGVKVRGSHILIIRIDTPSRSVRLPVPISCYIPILVATMSYLRIRMI